MKKNWVTYLILTATVILGAIAVFTAYKLYQIGKEPVAPTAPRPAPAAPLVEPTIYPTCFQNCTSNTDCLLGDIDTGLICGSEWCPPGQTCLFIDKCYNPECPTESTCICPVTEPAPVPACILEFEIEGPTGTPTPTETPVPGCWDTCDTDADCPDNLDCQEVNNTERCVNPDCPEESDCECPETTPTPTSTATPTATPTGGPTATPTTITTGGTPVTASPSAELPTAGLSLPSIALILAGSLLVLFGLAFLF